MTTNEYLSELIELLIIINQKEHGKVVLISLGIFWIVMTTILFIFMCSEHRVAVGTSAMWFCLMILGPVAGAAFIICETVVPKKRIQPMETKGLVMLSPIFISTLFWVIDKTIQYNGFEFAEWNVMNEKSIIAVLMGFICSTVISVVLITFNGFKQDICILDDGLDDIKKNRIKEIYYKSARERKKMRNESRYDFKITLFDPYRTEDMNVTLISKDEIDKYYLLSRKSGKTFDYMVYQTPDMKKIKVYQSEYPLGSYVYSYITGILIMLTIHTPVWKLLLNTLDHMM